MPHLSLGRLKLSIDFSVCKKKRFKMIKIKIVYFSEDHNDIFDHK